jgi:hypothetical protein
VSLSTAGRWAGLKVARPTTERSFTSAGFESGYLVQGEI